MNEPMIGKTIGKYRIVEHLGRGGMAEVYKAYQPNLDRYVAIKMMHTFLSDEKEFLARFEREAKVVATLRHPNIVQIYDVGEAAGRPYFVLEFVAGGSLRRTALEPKVFAPPGVEPPLKNVAVAGHIHRHIVLNTARDLT